jgi:dTDP-4-dehydrorhamnose 3,5-epimerase
MIDGVIITPLKKISDERGCVMHMLKASDSVFKKFGEIYFSTVYPGAIKAWHAHKKMTLNYAVIVGEIKLVLFDQRDNSPTKGEVQEIFLGEKNYCLVTVPPLVVNGFKGLGVIESIVANCSTYPHDPAEITRIDPFSKHIPYLWELKHG